MSARPSSFAAETADTCDQVQAVSHIWSQQQQIIFDWFARGVGNLVVRARAGTGKTTTILEGILHAPEVLICVCAYNTRIAQALKDRIGDKALAATLHSLGFQAIKRAWGRKVEVDDARGQRLTDAVCPPKVYASTRRNITKLHTAARESMPHCTDPAELVELALSNDCVQAGEDVQEICRLAYAAMEKAQERTLAIDFADMIFLPIRCGLLKARFDLVVVDECQDMSEPQLEIAQCLLKPGGRMVVVGDDRQAVYGFRGADSNSLDRLKRELDATELNLTTTYRCDRRIVEHAQEIVADIEPQLGALTGEVHTTSETVMYADAQPGDFILSRTNAPLVRTIMALLRDGRRARIEGRDIGKMLLGLHKRMAKYGDIQNVVVWEANLDTWAAQEIARAERADLTRRIEMVRDIVETLRALADGALDTDEITVRIEALFHDDIDPGDYIIGSTVHKAKGLEADRVWLLKDSFHVMVNCACGHRHGRDRVTNGMSQTCKYCSCAGYAPDPAALREEDNIRYVAITRAKHSLYWVQRDYAAR